MNIAEKIWYTWLVLAVFCFLSAFALNDDFGGKHQRAINILLAIGLMPIGIGLIWIILYILYRIWT